MSAVDDVYGYLETSGLAGGSTEWTLIRRRVTDTPPALDTLVVVAEDGGTGPEIPESSGIGDSALGDLGVLITVRAEALDGDSSAEKAEDIRLALHGQRDVVLVSGSDRYLAIRAQTPAPVFAGYDDQNRPLHTIAFKLLRLEGVSS